MPKKPVVKESLLGTCVFCGDEFEKSRMTQHLKHCKQRAAIVAAEKDEPEEKREQLFQILIEGRYNPQYWMYIEIPASESFYTLDCFLREIWVECCGHLSSFTIDKTRYEDEPGDSMFGGGWNFVISEESEKEEEEDTVVDAVKPGEEGKEGGEEEDDDIDLPRFIQLIRNSINTFDPEYRNAVSGSWLDELEALQSVDEVIAYAKQSLASMPKISRARSREEMLQYQAMRFRQSTLKMLIDELEDHTLDVPLEKVLMVGKKGTYEYDFGSTTDLMFYVIAERKGVLCDDEDPEHDQDVNVIARNKPPIYPCRVCGKPSTVVEAGYDGYGMDEHSFCNSCKKDSDEGDFLPIVNSPRVGVCGYTGGESAYDDEEDDEEEWEEDEEVDEKKIK